MGGKSAAQGFETYGNYSEDYVENPLKEMRGNVAQKDFAKILGVNIGVIASAEEAMFALIPTCYRQRIKNLMGMNEQYQAHRRVKRRFFFDPEDFPPTPSPKDPMLSLLNHFDLNPYKFGARACVHHSEIWKMCSTKRFMTENFRGFLVDIGVDKAWQDQFDAALSHNAPPKATLPGGS